MKKLICSLIILQCFLCSCQTDFVSSEWKKHNTIEDTKNPRKNMTNDLMENHLKKGMTKKEVIKLLGRPLSDTIMNYLPKHLKLPDSLRINYNIKETDEVRDKKIGKIVSWHKQNYLQARILVYPVGWSMIDPIFLKIRLSDKELVEDFWKEEH